MNFLIVIKEIGLRLRAIFKTKSPSVTKTKCAKLYLVLIFLDEIVLYIVRFLLKKFYFLYFIKCFLCTYSSYKPCSVMPCKLSYALIQQFIAAS